jgi:phosphate transport system protein
MSELEHRLESLTLRLDHMGMRAEQAVLDALAAVDKGDVEAGAKVDELDSVIDREEVEIEQECIRLLALYQPAAIDLRTICTVIKVNNDLERIADKGAKIGRLVKRIVEFRIDLGNDIEFVRLRHDTLDMLGRTTRMLSTRELAAARGILEMDHVIDEDNRTLIRSALHAKAPSLGVEGVWAMVSLARALERIGDLCANIAEDIIFLRTGDIVRHSDTLGRDAGDSGDKE